MSDSSEVIVSDRGRSIAAYVSLICAWCAIGGLLVLGDDANDLHVHGLDWSFWLIIALLLSQAAGLLSEFGTAAAKVWLARK